MTNETKSNTECELKQTEKDSCEPQRLSEVFVKSPYQLEQTLQQQPYQMTAAHNLYSPNLRPNNMYDYESGLPTTQYNTFPIPPIPKQVDYKTAFLHNQYQPYGNHFTEFHQLWHPHLPTGTPSLPSGAALSTHSPLAVTPLSPVQNNLLHCRAIPTSIPPPTYPQLMSIGQHQSTPSSSPIHSEPSIQLSQSPQNFGITSTASSNVWNSGVGCIGNNRISSQHLNWMYPPFDAYQQRNFQLFHSLYPMQPQIVWPQRPTFHECLSILAPAVQLRELKTVPTKAKARVSQLTSRTKRENKPYCSSCKTTVLDLNHHYKTAKHRRKLRSSGKSDPESILIKSPSSNSNFSNSVERPTELPELNNRASSELSKKKSPCDTFTDLSIG